MDGTGWNVTKAELLLAESLLRKIMADAVAGACAGPEFVKIKAASDLIAKMVNVRDREDRILAVVSDPGFRGGLAGFMQIMEVMEAE